MTIESTLERIAVALEKLASPLRKMAVDFIDSQRRRVELLPRERDPAPFGTRPRENSELAERDFPIAPGLQNLCLHRLERRPAFGVLPNRIRDRLSER